MTFELRTMLPSFDEKMFANKKCTHKKYILIWVNEYQN
jgi:hypothetical protein